MTFINQNKCLNYSTVILLSSFLTAIVLHIIPGTEADSAAFDVVVMVVSVSSCTVSGVMAPADVFCDKVCK